MTKVVERKEEMVQTGLRSLVNDRVISLQDETLHKVPIKELARDIREYHKADFDKFIKDGVKEDEEYPFLMNELRKKYVFEKRECIILEKETLIKNKTVLLQEVVKTVKERFLPDEQTLIIISHVFVAGNIISITCIFYKRKS